MLAERLDPSAASMSCGILQLQIRIFHGPMVGRSAFRKIMERAPRLDLLVSVHSRTSIAKSSERAGPGPLPGGGLSHLITDWPTTPGGVSGSNPSTGTVRSRWKTEASCSTQARSFGSTRTHIFKHSGRICRPSLCGKDDTDHGGKSARRMGLEKNDLCPRRLFLFGGAGRKVMYYLKPNG